MRSESSASPPQYGCPRKSMAMDDHGIAKAQPVLQSRDRDALRRASTASPCLSRLDVRVLICNHLCNSQFWTTLWYHINGARSSPAELCGAVLHKSRLAHCAEWRAIRACIQADTTQALGPLTTQNVMDYFSSSMFWDKSTNNQNLRMQTQFTGIPLAYADEAEQLKLTFCFYGKLAPRAECCRTDDSLVWSLQLYMPSRRSGSSIRGIGFPPTKVPCFIVLFPKYAQSNFSEANGSLLRD